MALRSGLAAQVGVAAETTWGLRNVPDHFYQFISEDIKVEPGYLESKARRASQRVLRTDQVVAYTKGATGSLDLEVASKGFGLLFKHALGAVAAPALVAGLTNSYKHVCTIGDRYGLGLTVQKGVPDTSGTVQVMEFNGGKIVDWELSNKVDEFLGFKVGLDFASVSDAQSLASASYPTSPELLHFVGGTVNVASGPVKVSDFSIKHTAPLKTDRYYVGSATKREQIENALEGLEGSITMEFESMTEYNRFRNNTIGQIDATWVSDTVIEATQKASLGVVLPKCQFRGTTPTVAGADVIEITLPFTVLWDGTNEPITLTYITLDATP